MLQEQPGNNYDFAGDAASLARKYLGPILLRFALAGISEAAIYMLLLAFHVISIKMSLFLSFIPILNIELIAIWSISSLAISLVIVFTVNARDILFYKWGVIHEIKRNHVPLWAQINVQEMIDDSATVQSGPYSLQDYLSQDKHIFLLGSPGAGKTIALSIYQYQALKCLKILGGKKSRIPVYVSLASYNAARNPSMRGKHQRADDVSQLTLFDYLQKNVKNIFRMRPPLERWEHEGRLLLLCDGLNEVNREYQQELCQVLNYYMSFYHNRVIITCREVDYNENTFLKVLADEEDTGIAFIRPLAKEQQDEFIRSCIAHGYRDERGKRLNCDPDEVIRFMDTRRLRNEYTSPFILLILMKLFDLVTVNSINMTYGQLLRKYVSRLIEEETQKIKRVLDFTSEELVLYLGEIACTARRLNCRNGIQLLTASRLSDQVSALQAMIEQASTEDVVEGETTLIIEPTNFDVDRRERMLSFALGASLLFIENSLLRFQHEIMAEYFVAEYLCVLNIKYDRLPYAKELVSTEGNWSEPIRIWAGFLDDAMPLAQQLGILGQDVGYGDKNSAYNALTLGMMSLGVHHNVAQWSMPPSLEGLLAAFVSNEEKQDRLAETFKRLAREVGDAVYRPLLKVLSDEPVHKLLLDYLPRPAICTLLFDHLVEDIASINEKDMSSLEKLLGKMGRDVVPRALELSKSVPQTSKAELKNHKRIRKASIDILGRTGEVKVVEPLIAYLDEEEEITSDVVGALKQLGPNVACKGILYALDPATGPKTEIRYLALLGVIETFLEMASPHPLLNPITHRDIIKCLMDALGYTGKIQNEAKKMLSQETSPGKDRAAEVLERLIVELRSENPTIPLIKIVLTQPGSDAAVKLLLRHLKSDETPDPMRCHIIDVLGDIQDRQAIDSLLERLAFSGELQQRVILALCKYPVIGEDEDGKPESFIVPKLIDVVLSSQKYNQAQAAAKVLKNIKNIDDERILDIAKSVLQPKTPERIILLLQVLQQKNDKKTLPVLLKLLDAVQGKEAALIIETIKTLSLLRDQSIVVPICDILTSWQCSEMVYEEAKQKLSQLTTLALPDILSKLEAVQGRERKERLLQSILAMQPFPRDMLLHMLGQCSEIRAKHIMLIFDLRGPEEAPFLVKHLCHANRHIKGYVHEMVHKMDANAVMEPLLDLVSSDVCHTTAVQFLRHYPDEAIPRLAQQLGDEQRSKAARLALIAFDTLFQERIHLLLPALNEQHNEKIQALLVEIVRKYQYLLSEVIDLFRHMNLPDDQQAYDTLVEMLSVTLANISIDNLISKLANDHLQMRWEIGRRGIMKTLVKIGSQDQIRGDAVIDSLISALYTSEMRSPVTDVLIDIGERAVPSVYRVCFDPDQQVSAAAHTISSRIGSFAMLYPDLDSSDRQRREVAEEILVNMDPWKIVVPLAERLASQDWQQIEQGLTILQGRLRAEKSMKSQGIVPVLLEHIQKREADHETLSLLTALLLIPHTMLLGHLNQFLSVSQQPPRWLAPLFHILTLESENGNARETLRQLVQNRSSLSPELYGELVSILGMLEPHSIVVRHARMLSQEASSLSGASQPVELHIARRALGSLLMSEQWDETELRKLQSDEQPDSVRHEFYSVLLGTFYAPRLAELREKFKRIQGEYSRLQVSHRELLNKNQQNLQKNEDLLKKVEELKNLHTKDIGIISDKSLQIEVYQQNLQIANEHIESLKSDNYTLQQALQGSNRFYHPPGY